jgi:anti-anti-sigma factor
LLNPADASGAFRKVIKLSRRTIQMDIYKRETNGDIVVITLQVQSMDAKNSQKIARRVAEAILDGERIVVDLGALRYFDVAGFAAILNWAGGGPRKAQVRFCSQSGAIRALFELLRANAVVPLYRSCEEAVASLGSDERRDAEVMVMARGAAAGAR